MAVLSDEEEHCGVCGEDITHKKQYIIGQTINVFVRYPGGRVVNTLPRITSWIMCGKCAEGLLEKIRRGRK